MIRPYILVLFFVIYTQLWWYMFYIYIFFVYLIDCFRFPVSYVSLHMLVVLSYIIDITADDQGLIFCDLCTIMVVFMLYIIFNKIILIEHCIFDYTIVTSFFAILLTICQLF